MQEVIEEEQVNEQETEKVTQKVGVENESTIIKIKPTQVVLNADLPSEDGSIPNLRDAQRGGSLTVNTAMLKMEQIDETQNSDHS